MKTHNCLNLKILLIGVLTIFTACEEKDGKAKLAPKTEAECPDEKIGSPITVEAVFLESACGEGCSSEFRLANGEKISLGGEVYTLKEGTKVSITYQKRQMWVDYDYIGQGQWCNQSDVLESFTVLETKK
jgi:hypothetical protein